MKGKFFVWLALVCMIIGSTFAPVLADEIQPRATTLNIANGDVTNDNCGRECTVTGTSESGTIYAANTIKINGGTHHIVLDNVHIDNNAGGIHTASAIDITGNADVTLELKGSNYLRGGSEFAVVGMSGHPAIWVDEGSTLTIVGSGNLEACAGNSTSGFGAAGIGAGYSGNFGNIIINSGNVIAKGEGGGAGIGGGYEALVGGDCSGNVTINGGYVKAYGSKTGNTTAGAGIGAGENADFVGTITINGGVVYAQSGDSDMPSIGGGGRITGETEHGTFKTGADGNAVIVAPEGIGANQNSTEWNGIFISYDSDENSATVKPDGTVLINDTDANIQVWGDPVLDYDLEIAQKTYFRIIKNDRNNESATLTIDSDHKLINNGFIVLGHDQDDPSYLILNKGLDQTSGTGVLQVIETGKAKVKLPLTDGLVRVNSNTTYTYNGKAQKPTVYVGFDGLWSYSQDFYEGTDYTRTDTNNVNAGQASVTLTATGTGNLLNGAVTKTYTIAPADFNLEIDKEWSVKEGETKLKLPKHNITIDPSIQDDTVDLKNGTLTWYLDKALKEKVERDSLKDYNAGDKVTLYAKYEHNDPNFVSFKVHELTVEIVKFTVHDAAIFEGGVNVTDKDLVRKYSLDKINLEAKIDLKGNFTDPLTGPISWSSSDESVATVDQNGEVTLVGVGQATITATIPEYNTGDDATSYARVSAEVDIEVTPREIKVDETTLKIDTRDYDGTKEVKASAELEADSIINNDDVTLVVVGELDSAGAGDDKTVNVKYSLSGADANNYVLVPDSATGTVTITKADPADHNMITKDGKLTIKNKTAKTYYFALNNLVPDDVTENGVTYDFGQATFMVESVDDNPYFTKDDISIVGNGNFLKVDVKAVDTDVEGVIGNITIGLDSTNYEHMTAKIEVSAENSEITVEPEEPTDPSDPADPSEPGDKPAQDPEIVVPDTGSSDSNMLIYVSLGVAALCALIIVIASKKKQNLGK